MSEYIPFMGRGFRLGELVDEELVAVSIPGRQEQQAAGSSQDVACGPAQNMEFQKRLQALQDVAASWRVDLPAGAEAGWIEQIDEFLFKVVVEMSKEGMHTEQLVLNLEKEFGCLKQQKRGGLELESQMQDDDDDDDDVPLVKPKKDTVTPRGGLELESQMQDVEMEVSSQEEYDPIADLIETGLTMDDVDNFLDSSGAPKNTSAVGSSDGPQAVRKTLIKKKQPSGKSPGKSPGQKPQRGKAKGKGKRS